MGEGEGGASGAVCVNLGGCVQGGGDCGQSGLRIKGNCHLRPEQKKYKQLSAGSGTFAHPQDEEHKGQPLT